MGPHVLPTLWVTSGRSPHLSGPHGMWISHRSHLAVKMLSFQNSATSGTSRRRDSRWSKSWLALHPLPYIELPLQILPVFSQLNTLDLSLLVYLERALGAAYSLIDWLMYTQQKHSAKRKVSWDRRAGMRGPGEKGVSSHDFLASLLHFHFGGGRCVFVWMAINIFFIFFFQRSSTKPKVDRKTGSNIQAQGQGNSCFKSNLSSPTRNYNAWRASPEEVMREAWQTAAFWDPHPHRPPLLAQRKLFL